MTTLKPPALLSELMKLLLALLLLGSTHFVIAEEDKKTKLLSPPTLDQAKLEKPDDITPLMQSEEFKREIIELAELVNQELPADLSVADNMALNSLLNNHEKTLVLINSQKEPHSFFYHKVFSEFFSKKGTINQKAKANIGQSEIELLTIHMQQQFNSLSNQELNQANYSLGWSLSLGRDYLLAIFKRYPGYF